MLQWHETQDNLKLTLQRNIYGMHAPVRLLMERKIVSRVRNACQSSSPMSRTHKHSIEPAHARPATVESASRHPYGP
jgi:proteasome maturation protein